MLYLCLDTSRQTLQRRLAALCLGRGIDPPAGLYFDLSPLDLSQPRSLDTLRGLVKEHGAGLVILDALARYLPGIDENTVASISPVLTGLRSLVTSDGTTILLLHHLNKGSGYAYNAPSSLRIRGSSDILAAVDTALVCTGGSAGSHAQTVRRLIPVKNREQPESPPSIFNILPIEGGGLRISFDDPAAKPYVLAAPFPATAFEGIRAFLQQNPGQPFTRREIEQHLHAEGIPAGSRTLDRAFAVLRKRPDIWVEREGTTLRFTWKNPPSPPTP